MESFVATSYISKLMQTFVVAFALLKYQKTHIYIMVFCEIVIIIDIALKSIE